MSEDSKDFIEVTGIVREILPNFSFKVELENGTVLDCIGSGKLRKKRIRISVLDKVAVEISKYNINLGRISRRIDEKRFEDRRALNKQRKR